MDILIASNNAHKIGELAEILPDHRLIPCSALFQDFDPDETGSTFLENAVIKAYALADLIWSPAGTAAWEAFAGSGTGLPAVLSDDSGICVDYLDGAPGIRSARFGHDEAGRKLSPGEQNVLLLEKLAGVSGDRRSARYICCMVLGTGPNQWYSAQDSWEGFIADEDSQATGGFGYDPIFYLPEAGCTVAELPEGEKASLSHRAKATRTIAKLLA